MPAEVVPRIFDELFTTKEPGAAPGSASGSRATSSSRGFGGTSTVEVDEGSVGSCFSVIVPEAQLGQSSAAHARASVG